MGEAKAVRRFLSRNWPGIALGVAVLGALYVVSLDNYLLFHSLVETFSVVVACGVFVIAWNSRRTLDNSYFLLVGIGYLFVAGVDLLHMLAYRGMGVFAAGGSNLPTQLWLGSRFLQAGALLTGPLVVGRRPKARAILLAFAVATSFLLASVFAWRIFPVCYVEGQGLTPFKVASEYVICVAFAASAGLLVLRRKGFDPRVLRLLLASAAVAVASELAFTEYVGVYDKANMVGHMLEVVSFYLMYKAVIETGLVRPYDLLFRDLKLSQEALKDERDRIRQYLRIAGVMLVVIDARQRAALINRKGCDILGWAEDQIVGRNWFDEFVPVRMREEVRGTFGALMAGRVEGPAYCENHVLTRSGEERLIAWHNTVLWDDRGQAVGTLSSGEDITQSRAAQEALQVSHRFLEIANRHTEIGPLLDEYVTEVRSFTGCAAAGVRLLDEDGSIPYQSYRGFSRAFYEAESPLSIHSHHCICIRVITGQIAPERPYYTPAGSFYMGGTTQFLAGAAEGERGGTRNACNAFGYETVVLIPIRLGDRILGLVHVADPRENAIPRSKVEVLEKAVMALGPAMERLRAEEALREAHAELERRVQDRTAELSRANLALRAEVAERQRAEAAVTHTRDLLERVFGSLNLLIAYMDTSFNFVRVNRAYAEADGRPPDFFVGKNHFDLYPNEENKAIFRTVVQSGKPYSTLAKPFVYPDHPERGVTYWDWTLQPVRDSAGAVTGVVLCLVNVTERKRAEEKLLAYQEQLRSLADKLSLAEERERRRIASELHDRIGQALAVSKIKLGLLQQAASAAGFGEGLKEVRDLIDQTVRDTRSLTFDLSPPVLYELGLGAAIEWLAERMQQQHDLRVVFEDGKQPLRLDGDVGVLLFYAVRELLLNVVKHADASMAKVALRSDGREVRISVEDDGVGFDAASVSVRAHQDSGFGLFNIRERLQNVGGRLEIESQPGQGTRALLVVPFRNA